MKRSLIVAAFVLALPAQADTVAAMKSAVAALHGTQPLHATAELKRTDADDGRFSNDHFSADVTFEIAVDRDGAHMTFSPGIVERLRREQREHAADPKKVDAASRTLAHVGPLWVLDHLNASDTFLAMLVSAKLQSETRTTAESRPATLLIFRVDEAEPQGFKGLGSVSVKENRLKVWIGDDNLPLAAERVEEAAPRVLFFHGTVSTRESWSFAHVGDHLVITRHDSSHNAEMMGQKSRGETSDVLTVR